MGNICRSPVVEAVARVRFARAGLDIEVDSAGTEDYHVGEPPDRRSLASALARGYDASSHRARQVETEDFERFDKLLVMDRINLRALARIAPGSLTPPLASRVVLPSPAMRERDVSGRSSTADSSFGHDRIAMFLPWAGVADPHDLPDPYYGQAQDFEHVVTLAERGIDGLIAKLGIAK